VAALGGAPAHLWKLLVAVANADHVALLHGEVADVVARARLDYAHLVYFCVHLSIVVKFHDMESRLVVALRADAIS
jgi:hypothetical protein